MSENQIADDEVLYRRVPSHIKGLLKRLPDGNLGVSASAFAESSYRPSVDRALLRENDPKRTLGAMVGGVVSIVTGNVRAIDNLVQYNKDQKPLHTFTVDVTPDPIFDAPDEPGGTNLAHAEISMQPVCSSAKVFRRLCERLALLANNRPWEIEPPPPQSDIST